ncbi:MAG: metallophosphoesterase family protein [Chloroflexota bacterium]|nr:metallophosphoesterase family protein [Chloroflexota bacterium]
MTRLAALADIHGNLPALHAVIDDMRQFNVDQVVVAGDSVNWGPFSRQVLELIFRRRWALIRGNNAFYALDYNTTRAPDHWARFSLPPILREQLGGDWLNAISCLPDSLSLRFMDAPPLRVFHGLPDNPWQAIFPNSAKDKVADWLRGIREGTVICAHSHIPMERQVGRWQIFNPGSVGVPLDGKFSASYMILDGHAKGWELAAHRRVPFDYDPLYREFERQNFVERGGVTARLVIEEFRSARLQVHPFVLWKLKHFADRPDDFELLRAFLDLDDVGEYMPPAYRNLNGPRAIASK